MLYCRWLLLSVGVKCVVFFVIPEYLQIVPEGSLQCDVVPPVFKAHCFPWVPRQIVFLASPAGKETLSLLGFGCHITLKDARANSTFLCVPTGKVTITKRKSL